MRKDKKQGRKRKRNEWRIKNGRRFRLKRGEKEERVRTGRS